MSADDKSTPSPAPSGATPAPAQGESRPTSQSDNRQPPVFEPLSKSMHTVQGSSPGTVKSGPEKK